MSLQTLEAEMGENNVKAQSWWEVLCSQPVESDLPSFFKQQKQLASEFIKTNGWPTFAEEDWKYTTLKSVQKQGFKKIGSDKSAEAYNEDIRRRANENEQTLSQQAVVNVKVIDGHYYVPSIATNHFELKLLSQCSAALQKVLSIKALKLSANLNFNEALAWAGADDALCLWVHSQGTEKLIINLEHITTSNQLISCPLLFIILEEDLHCEVLESFSSKQSDTALTAAVSYSFLAPAANLKHLKIISDNQFSYHLSSAESFLAGKANYNSLVLSLGCSLIRNNLITRLEGEYAHANLFGTNVLNQQQHVDNHTVLDHIAPNCESLEIYKGVYADKSKGIFDGTIIVRPAAQKTNAIQSSRALLLSNNASAFSKPQLKIWADDVKCTHGAAVGQLDEQALFYLRSRGINKQEARKILTKSFIAETIEKIAESKIKEILFEQVNDRLDEILLLE